jgi:hypothetical protein
MQNLGGLFRELQHIVMVNIGFAKFCIDLLQSADRAMYSVTQDRSRVVQRMPTKCRSM